MKPVDGGRSAHGSQIASGASFLTGRALVGLPCAMGRGRVTLRAIDQWRKALLDQQVVPPVAVACHTIQPSETIAEYNS